MEVTGKIIAVLQPNSGVSARTGNPWMSQEYVLETHDQYPRKVCFRIFGEDKIKQFSIQMGEELNVSFDIDAHEYNGRWYNTLSAWNVTRAVAQNAAAPASAPFTGAPQQSASPFPPAPENIPSTPTDDLPF